jgi:hypothetical protein
MLPLLGRFGARRGHMPAHPTTISSCGVGRSSQEGWGDLVRGVGSYSSAQKESATSYLGDIEMRGVKGTLRGLDPPYPTWG